MKSFVFILIWTTLLAAEPAGAQSRLNCEATTAQIRPYLARLRAPAPTRVKTADLPSRLRTVVEAEGGEVFRLGSGGYAQVYRWDLPGQEPIAVKVYGRGLLDPEADAKSDDERLEILQSVSRPEDYVQVLAQVRPPIPGVRFYRYVRGLTGWRIERRGLQGLLFGPPRQVRRTVHDALQSYYTDVIERLKARYGAKNVWPYILSDGSRFQVHVDGQWITFWLHRGNWVLDADTGRLVIIDPL